MAIVGDEEDGVGEFVAEEVLLDDAGFHIGIITVHSAVGEAQAVGVVPSVVGSFVW